MNVDWWTLLFQTVNVLILLWILARFFFRPLADIVAQRQKEANELLDNAATRQTEAADVQKRAEQELKSIAAKRDQMLAEASDVALAQKTAILSQASEDIKRQKDEATAVIAHEKALAEKAVISHASDLSIEISRKLLSQIPADALLQSFLDRLCEELRKPSVREQLTAFDQHQTAELVSAAPLTEEQKEKAAALFHKALGHDIPLAFRTNSALLAGLEFRSRNVIIQCSWQADLKQIREELNND